MLERNSRDGTTALFRPRGTIENRKQYLENRRTGRVDFESLVANDIKVRVYENTAARSGYSPTPRCYGTPRRPLILPRRSHQTH